ncbi:MAG: DUF1732 domain-containing protein, partial [Clostridia bacterium]|nr:DUF1732 domain-containing protein [Clostridia bacterium]
EQTDVEERGPGRFRFGDCDIELTALPDEVIDKLVLPRTKVVFLGEGADMTRVMQEAAIMADKAAINEETVRLRTHLEHARQLCDNAEPAGRSLDFLVQEMNREVNTISSKSQDIPITQAVLQSKSAIEKLREQLQNVE